MNKRSRLQQLVACSLGVVAVTAVAINVHTARSLGRATSSFASDSVALTALVNADRQAQNLVERAHRLDESGGLDALMLSRQLLERHLTLVGVSIPAGHPQWPLLAEALEQFRDADRLLARMSSAATEAERTAASAELLRVVTAGELATKRLYDASENMYFGSQRAALDAGRRTQHVLVVAGVLTALLGGLLLVSVRRKASAELRHAYAELLAESEERVLAQRALGQNERRFRALVDKASDVISVLDRQAVVRYQSPAVETALGVPTHQVLGRPLLDLIHADDVAAVHHLFQRAVRKPCLPQTASISMLRGTDALMFEMTMTNYLDDEDVNGVVVNYRDITDRVTLQQQLTDLAYNDALTGLPNRTAFQHRLDDAAAADVDVAVLFIDLDHFKLVNDSLGHATGDELLCQVARRLTGCLRPGDLLARLGGDEFTVVVQGSPALPDVAALAGRLLASLGGAFEVEGQILFVDASVGVATAHAGRAVPADLVCNADAAMYQAKTKGRGRVELYESGQHDLIVSRLELHTALRGALAANELTVHYQPVRRFEDGKICAFEALARWTRPDGESVPPDIFIPLAEELGFIKQLGQWVMREACQQLADWQRAGVVDADVRMNVNLSAVQFRDPSLLSDIAATLDATGLASGSLTVELTETAILLDRTSASATLRALQRVGVNVALDDFGIGYSSLSCLAELPINCLKIDRSFVTGLGLGTRNYAILEAVMRLASSLGIEAVAEGVETLSEHELLAALGCTSGQGYLYARPGAAGDVAAQLAPRVPSLPRARMELVPRTGSA